MQDTEILERVGSPAVLPSVRTETPALAAEGALENLGRSEGYDISIRAHDFNIFTLCNFLDRGVITVPFFQRGFVWDRRRASRFIESVALGLPVPELFFFQAESNDWWVVDGHQRVLSVHFFKKGRFPRPQASVEISRLMSRNNVLSEEKWRDGRLFSDFALDLGRQDGETPGALNGMSYGDLGEGIERRSLRAVVIRQHTPKGDKAAFEIFHRLNTGGVNLSQQQIRMCIYRSGFLDMVDELNVDPAWRSLLGKKEPAKTGVDAESVLRAFAMLEDGDKYGQSGHGQSMRGFLNEFCGKKVGASGQDVKFLRELFAGFLCACGGGKNLFHRGNKFSPTLFEAVFAASLRKCRRPRRMPKGELKPTAVAKLINDPDFEEAARQSSNTKAKVRARLNAARRHIAPL